LPSPTTTCGNSVPQDPRYCGTRRLAAGGHRLKQRLEPLEKLTPYGVAYRYPSEDAWEIPPAATIEAWLTEVKAIRSMM
jgi:hypothetical protein